jgi:uncharacterized protein
MLNANAADPGASQEALELHGLRIPLRDGVELAADVFVPQSRAARPLIVEITPYGRGPESMNFRSEAPYWHRHGYAFAVVDCRGTGDSGGEFVFMSQEGEDGHDVVEWLARQPWCNGRIGMRGASYSGGNQWFTARQRPPHLRAIVPNASGTGSMDDVTYLGGIFHFGWALPWIGMSFMKLKPAAGGAIDWAALLKHRPLRTADEQVYGRVLPLYRQLLEHPLRDDFQRHSEMSDADYAGIDLPALAFSGWLDGTLQGTLEHFGQMRRHSPARAQQWLVVGPWEHGPCSEGGTDYLTGLPITQVGDQVMPPHSLLPGQEITRAFYDAHLKDGPAFDAPTARLYITGVERWLHSADWPPPGIVLQPWHLRSSERLLPEAPGTEAPDCYLSDPMNPVPSTAASASGEVRSLVGWPVDLKPLVERDDVLVYLSDPMVDTLTVVGDVEALLWISSDAPDFDVVVRIEDVDPQGRGRKLGSKNAGLKGARTRMGLEREVLLKPGELAELRVRLMGIGHAFLPGHRIRLSVCGTAYPDIFPNPHSGACRATDRSEPRVATQWLHHDATHPSRLVLPVLAWPQD